MRTWVVLDGAMVLLRADGWCQGAYARNAAGGKVDELSEAAGRRCLLGALRRAAGNEVETPVGFTEAVWECYEQARLERLRPSLIAWQDAPGRTLAEVLGFLGRVMLRVRDREVAEAKR